MESINFIIQGTRVKHPNNSAVIKLNFINAFMQIDLLGSSMYFVYHAGAFSFLFAR